MRNEPHDACFAPGIVADIFADLYAAMPFLYSVNIFMSYLSYSENQKTATCKDPAGYPFGT